MAEISVTIDVLSIGHIATLTTVLDQPVPRATKVSLAKYLREVHYSLQGRFPFPLNGVAKGDLRRLPISFQRIPN